VLNSQLWGELQLVVVRKGLQPVTLSLYRFPTRLLFPVIAICVSVLLEYSMPEFELNVQGFILTSTHKSLRACGPREKKEARDTLALPAKGSALCTPGYEWMSDL